MGGAALPIISTGLGALGNILGPKTSAAVPGDLQGPRSNQINLIDYLLGGAGAGKGAQNAFGNIQQYFGNLGVPQSDLQRQSAGGLSNMLSNESPYSKALNSAYGSLNEMLQPGTNNPMFDRDMAMANQQGGRFSSANEFLRAGALANQWQMRNQAANTFNALGQGQAGVLGQGYGVGQAQAQQGDINMQRMLSLFGGLLGLRQQGTMGLPITQTPNWAQSLGGAGLGLSGILPFMGGMANQGGQQGGGGFTYNSPQTLGAPGSV